MNQNQDWMQKHLQEMAEGEKYEPGQARDESGRFAGGGGSNNPPVGQRASTPAGWTDETEEYRDGSLSHKFTKTQAGRIAVIAREDFDEENIWRTRIGKVIMGAPDTSIGRYQNLPDAVTATEAWLNHGGDNPNLTTSQFAANYQKKGA